MLVNYLNKLQTLSRTITKKQWVRLVLLPAWVVAGFFLAMYALQALIYLLLSFNISFVGIDRAVVNAFLAALIYVFTIVIVIGVPWLVQRSKTTKEELGASRLPSWMDIILSPAGFVVYFLLSLILSYIGSQIIPGFSADQAQQTGFSHLTYSYEYIMAFVTLIIVAPIAEETLFRGYLFGKLRKFLPFWATALITSALFGLVHGQWNVGIDVFALSLVLCVLREMTGSIWSGVLLHMLKNAIAFYIIFSSLSF